MSWFFVTEEDGQYLVVGDTDAGPPFLCAILFDEGEAIRLAFYLETMGLPAKDQEDLHLDRLYSPSVN